MVISSRFNGQNGGLTIYSFHKKGNMIIKYHWPVDGMLHPILRHTHSIIYFSIWFKPWLVHNMCSFIQFMEGKRNRKAVRQIKLQEVYWLVVSTPLKHMKVSWDDYSQDMENKKTCSKSPISTCIYVYMYVWCFSFRFPTAGWINNTELASYEYQLN